MLKKGLLVYAVLVFLFFVLLALSVFAVVESKKIVENYQQRQTAIDTYNKLDLDKSYVAVGFSDSKATEIFSANYGRDSGRQATFDDLEKQITAAGFAKVESPDNGSFARQDHYQNDQGQSIYVSIATSAWHNAMTYGTELPDPRSKEATEQGPVYVTIDVDLGNDKH